LPNQLIYAGDVLRIADELQFSEKSRVDLLDIMLNLSPASDAVMIREIGASIAELSLPFEGFRPAEEVARELLNAIRLFTAGKLSEAGLRNIWEQSAIHRVAEMFYDESLYSGMASALWAFVNAAFDHDGDEPPRSVCSVIDAYRDARAEADPRYIEAQRMALCARSAEATWQHGTHLDFSFVKEATEQHLQRLLNEIQEEQSETVNGLILDTMKRHLVI
jgi:hypothetical protein